jgi:FAD/FMN-containing dehydrogenase
MKICNLFGTPVVAYAGGTSLEGNFSALQGGEMPLKHQKSGKFPQALNVRALATCLR